MKENYTHLVLLVDRSGSMRSIKEDMEGGIKTFLDQQKQEVGTCTVTVAQFDDVFEILHKRVDINALPNIVITPNGMTALIDSMAKLINEVGKDLDSLDEAEKPDRVLFVTITDGGENSSKEYTNNTLSKLIKEQEDKYKWNFTYIGANQDSFGTSAQIGVKGFKTMNYKTSKEGINMMFTNLNNATSRYRSVSSADVTGDSFGYTLEEQKKSENGI